MSTANGFANGEGKKKKFFLIVGVENIGSGILKNVAGAGHILSHSISSLRWLFDKPYRFKEIIYQIEYIGNQSVFIICLTGLFTGMVFALQTYAGFHMVNADALVAPTVGLGITRELGPVFAGIILTARAGAAMAAQLGTMRVTEQIDALEVMGVNPKQYLVMPRIVGAMIATPLMGAIFFLMGNFGGWFICTKGLGIDSALYISKAIQYMEPRDLVQGLIKCCVFGFVFASIGTTKGFQAENGARGVGQATNMAVVLSCIFILVGDYFLTVLIQWYFKFLT